MYESAVAQPTPLQHTHPAERVGSLCHSECRDRRDCLDFRRVTGRRPLVNTATPLFFPPPTTRPGRPSSSSYPPHSRPNRPSKWRTPLVGGAARYRGYESRGRKVISNRTATFSPRCICAPGIWPATIKTSGSCRKLLKWHARHKRPRTLIRLFAGAAVPRFRRRSRCHKVCNRPSPQYRTHDHKFFRPRSLKCLAKEFFPRDNVAIALIALWEGAGVQNDANARETELDKVQGIT